MPPLTAVVTGANKGEQARDGSLCRSASGSPHTPAPPPATQASAWRSRGSWRSTAAPAPC